ncbi:GPD1L [Cervus elaphus hippelaphus]|uniref:GPD1L n=1 Tax=Cervus elaphus hippelaphus TaxID=46360 RepID=A0A212C9P9_CEREH|nr:GPD1L [Cervus elaphus hippelaphus]
MPANLGEAVQDADLLVFVIPHQFIHRICDEITGRVPKDALGITLIKTALESALLSRLGASAGVLEQIKTEWNAFAVT